MLTIDSFQVHARMVSITMVNRQIRKRMPVALAVCAAGIVTLGVHAPSPVFGEINSLPPLELVDTRGERHSFVPAPAGKEGGIFFFFEPNSAAGVLEMTFLERLYSKIVKKGMQVVAIEASGLDGEEIGRAMDRYRRLFPEPSFPIVADPDYTLSRLFNVTDIPSTYIAGKDGSILCRIEGFSKEKQVELTKKIIQSFSAGAAGEDVLKGFGDPEEAKPAGEDGEEELVAAGVGDRIPPLVLTDLNGAVASSDWSSDGASVNIVFFWGAMCLPCMREMTYLEEISRDTSGRGLRVFAVQATGLDPQRTAVLMKRYKRVYPEPSFPIIPDADHKVRKAFGVKLGGPATFFVDREGIVTFMTDEFPKGYENTLAKKIEHALLLGSDSLRLSMNADQDSGNSTAGEMVSVHRDREEVFNENLARGDYYFSVWNYEEALPCYLKALSVKNNELQVISRVASIFERTGRKSAALESWKKILSIDADNAEAREHAASLEGEIEGQGSEE